MMPMMEAMMPKARAYQREEHPRRAEDAVQRRAQHHRADILRGGGFEQVRAAPRAIAHVVSHKVGDDGRVPRVVLWNTRLDLAHEVGAHVSGLRIDAAAQLCEKRHQRCAEAETDDQPRRLS